MEDQVLMMLRGQVSGIILGTVFLFIGLAACAIAVIRGGGRIRILVWFGIFSALYGARKLEQVVRDNHSSPPSELSEQLLREIRHWQPPSVTQQDDITLIIIDVV